MALTPAQRQQATETRRRNKEKRMAKYREEHRQQEILRATLIELMQNCEIPATEKAGLVKMYARLSHHIY